jgi:hypothetical protein
MDKGIGIRNICLSDRIPFIFDIRLDKGWKPGDHLLALLRSWYRTVRARYAVPMAFAIETEPTKLSVPDRL